MYNVHNYRNSGGQSELAKALDSANASALIAQDLEQIITNTVQRLSPEINMIKPIYSPTKIHEYNQLSSLGSAGGAMGENATTPTKSSTYARKSKTLKIIRRKGSVTNFLNDASKEDADSMAVEMENVIRAHVYDLNFYNLFGNETANPFEPSGWNTFIESNRLSGITSGATTVPSTLKFLDDMIDLSNRKGGARHKRFFAMSPEMLSLVSRLLTNVRLNQGMDGQGMVDISGGWRLNAYRDIPIIETTFMGGKGSVSMGSLTLDNAGTTGGSLSNGAYYVRVVAVTLDGKSIPSAEATITLSGGGSAQKFDITFTPIADAYHYEVYAGTTTGATNTTLKKIVSAFTYDGEGTISGTTDTITFDSLTVGSEVGSRTGEIPMVQQGSISGEEVALIDCDPYQGLGKYIYTHSTGNRVDGLVSIKPLAETDDYVPFLVKTYGALVPSFEATSVWYTGLRVQ